MTPEAIQILFIAIAVSIGSSIVSKLVVNQDRMDEIKAKVNDFQKRYAKARKDGNAEEIKKLEVEQKGMMSMTKEMMMSGFKPMLYTFVPLIAILFGLGSVYGNSGLIVEVPVFGLLNYLGWYIVVAIISGLVFELVYKQYRKKKKGDKNGTTTKEN